MLPTDSWQCILPVSLPSFLITSSLSGLWETWQVPSPLRQVCSTPWHRIGNLSRLISTFRPQHRGSSRRQPASAGGLWGSPCCTLVKNSISSGKATLNYTKGYFVREDNMVQAGEIWSTFTRNIWSNLFYALQKFTLYYEVSKHLCWGLRCWVFARILAWWLRATLSLWVISWQLFQNQFSSVVSKHMDFQ